MIVIFIVVNQIEANVIGPKIIGERVGLHPLAVIFAILAGGELLGIVGMLRRSIRGNDQSTINALFGPATP